ncbi:hypothetical protein B4417_1301 [Bacillus subtilis]|nr:hypothetical protein BS732_2656 [Bacillus subtilis MB73/2]KZD85226.1 hypothetical protein B4417_1301 [Bacillus subtilis]
MNKFPYNFQKKIKNMVEFRFIFLYIKKCNPDCKQMGRFYKWKSYLKKLN